MEKRILENRYELLEEIGDGGTATVFKARCTVLDRIVAVKILKEELARDQAFVRKFRSEAQAAAQLSHPNIVNIYDVGEEDGLHYIVMEYVEGTSLNDYIDARAPLLPDDAIRIAVMICDALEQAHSRGIIHRDIKPHNILMTPEGEIKVADFGIARAPRTSTITYSGNIMGSVHYISPEHARGAVVDATTDIYSLGCLMYEMLTGQVPLMPKVPVTVALKHIHEEPTPPRVLNEAIPSVLEKIVLTAMAKNPIERYRSAVEMKQSLVNLHPPDPNSRRKKRNADTIVIPSLIDEGDDDKLARKRKVKPMGRLVLVVALIGLLAGLTYGMRGMIFGQEVEVPEIRNLSAREAYNQLAEAGLKMEKIGEEYNSEIEAGHVVTQDPEPGKMVKEGRQVRVILSKGPEMVKVPNLVNTTLSDARFELKNMGLQLGEPENIYDNRVPEGNIVSQEPRANRQVPAGSSVDVMVSLGPKPEQTQVPDLVGKFEEEAKSSLQARKLAIGKVDRQDSTEYFAGQVVSQDPKSGLVVDKDASVSIVVSKGPGPMPRTVPINVTLPTDEDYYQVTAVVKDIKGERLLERNIYGGGDEVKLTVNYYGKGMVEVYLNGELYKKYAV